MNTMFPCFDGPPCYIKIDKDGVIDYHDKKFVMKYDDGKKYKGKYAIIFAGEGNIMSVAIYKTKNDRDIDSCNEDKMLSYDVWIKMDKKKVIK